jgi:hypothetical protein
LVSKEENLRLALGRVTIRCHPEHKPKDEVADGEEHRAMKQITGSIDGFGPLQECWKPAFARYLIPKYTGLRLDLDRYLNYYNTDRAHTGRWTKGRTPEQVIGKVKMWSR